MVEMNGAYSDAIDSPARFCFMVTKAGKPKSACPPRLIVGNGAPPTLGHFVLMLGLRGTRDGSLYTCRRFCQRTGFCSFPVTKPRPLPCRSNRVCQDRDTPGFPVIRASRYNTLHLAAQGRVPKGGRLPPLETPVLSACGYSPHLRPAPPPLQNTKEQRTSAHHHGPICAAPLSGLRAGDEG